ncbi:MAG: LpqB family beta-propeller domain-containing protein [Ardenticatenales bacterium]
MTTHILRTIRSLRAGTPLVLATLFGAALLGVTVAACGGAPSEGGVDPDALSRLTEVALGTSTPSAAGEAPATMVADNGAAAGPSATIPAMDAMATTISGNGGENDIPPLPTDPLPANMGSDSNSSPDAVETQSSQVRATEDAKNQIANVDELVQRQPALATFTPPAKPAPLSGSLLFARGGTFYTAKADGSQTAKLALENSAMPSVWAPPDDPGRAWTSPDGRRVAFFAGSDAALWVMDVDGKNGRQLHANVLPNEVHKIKIGSDEMNVKLRPGSDYTLVLTPGGSTPMGVLVDNNEYHKHGQSRIRVVHAARGLADTTIIPIMNGQPISRAAYGHTNGESAFGVGPTTLEIRAQGATSLASFKDLTLADKEVKTFFLYGDKSDLKINGVDYEPGTHSTAGKSRVRIFNAGTTPVDLLIDGKATAVRAVAEGQISPYVEAQGTLGEGELEDMRIDIYGLRAGEEPLVWSPDGSQLAFISGESGQHDLWVTSVDGKARQVTNDQSREINPMWSPDGKRMLWTSLDDLNQTVKLMVQTGTAAPVTVDLAIVRQTEKVPADKPITFAEPFGWIDNDTFYITPRAELVTKGIWTFDVDKAKLSPAYTGPVDGVEWSATANAWAFNAAPAEWAAVETLSGEAYVLPRDGKAKRVVDANAFFPQWSPDGKRIIIGEGQPTDGSGWRMIVMDADGGGRRYLTEKLPILQSSPPVPGPRFKLAWSNDNKTVLFSRVGRDYGLKDRVGVVGSLPSAGDDIENYYAVKVDGSAPAEQITDLTKAFYLNEIASSPDGNAVALIGFTYLDRTQRLLVVASGGSQAVSIDTPVRWFTWVK